MVFARLSAVYGMSFGEIGAMPLAAIVAYLERIPAIQAERRLIAADGALTPWMKHPERQVKTWSRLAYGPGTRSSRPATPGQLKMLGIMVVKVDRNKPEPG